jgi:DNA mismatch repair protein MutL
MKSVNTEMGHIADVVANIAAARPDVRFKLTHNGNTVKRLTADDPAERVFEIFGGHTKQALRPIAYTTGELTVIGWITGADESRRSAKSLYTYVNGRFVKDRVVRHAVMAGCEERFVKGRFPVAVIFLTLPADMVDVNVHPAKQEVRFGRRQTVHDAVAYAVRQALSAPKASRFDAGRPPAEGTLFAAVGEEEPEFTEAAPAAEPVKGTGQNFPGALPSSQKSTRWTGPSAAPPRMPPRREYSFSPASPRRQPDEGPNGFPPDRQPAHAEADTIPPPPQARLWQSGETLRFIGRLADAYLICEAEDSLVLVDQHAAHERIVYEALRRTYRGDDAPPAQRLLMPETLEFTHAETDILAGLLPEFEKIGFEIESFGPRAFAVKAHPTLLSADKARESIREIVETLAETGVRKNPADAVDESLKILACHGAIRTGNALTDAEVKRLLEDLLRCENPDHCPHGRPVKIAWSKRFIEKAFKRVV